MSNWRNRQLSPADKALVADVENRLADPTPPSPTQHPGQAVDLDEAGAELQQAANTHSHRPTWNCCDYCRWADAHGAALLADLDAAREALRRVEQERDEARRLNAICTCYDGNPQNYEGPHADCPIHGAIRAFNEASANLAAALEQRDDARAGLAAAEAKLAKPCGECHPCTEWPAETWKQAGLRLPHVIDWQDMVAERDALRKLTAVCTCYDGNPQNYEGPHADCPIHGAIRAYNEVSADLVAALEQRDEARAAVAAVEAERDRFVRAGQDAIADLDAAREALRRAERERDSLARRCALRFEETEKLRAEVAAHEGELGDMRASLSAAEANLDEARAAQIVVQCDDPEHAERDRMRPVVEAARAARRAWWPMPPDLAAAVDTYETQEGTE